MRVKKRQAIFRLPLFCVRKRNAEGLGDPIHELIAGTVCPSRVRGIQTPLFP